MNAFFLGLRTAQSSCRKRALRRLGAIENPGFRIGG